MLDEVSLQKESKRCQLYYSNSTSLDFSYTVDITGNAFYTSFTPISGDVKWQTRLKAAGTPALK